MKSISYKEIYDSTPTSYRLVRFGKGQKFHIVPNTINQPYCIKARNLNLEDAIEIVEIKDVSKYQENGLCKACNLLLQGNE